MSHPPPTPSPDLSDLLTRAAGAYAAGRLADAEAAYAEAERLAPSDFRAPYSRAVIALRLGRFDEAQTWLRRVVGLEPGHFAAWHNLGAAAQSLQRWDEAADAFARALALRPDAAETAFNLATALAILGQTEEAAEVYRRLARQAGPRLAALVRLAMLSPAGVDAAGLADLEAAARRATGDDLAPLAFAAAAVHDAAGRDDAAFAAYAAGNEARRAALMAGPADRRPAAVQADYDAAARTARARTAPPPLPDATGPVPIFIVGMPRCGSTLVEQILAAHPQVQGLGETAALGQALDAHGEDLLAAREAYLAALRRSGWDGERRPVDKTLENHLRPDLMRAMFPRAVILHAVRDPVETALGCYRQLFASGNETLYDLVDIAVAYRAYRGLVDHWRAHRPGLMVEVAHARLVAEPEAAIRWLVTDACGLPWDPACLSFHRAKRPVRSASAAQVRQPIFAARPYRARWAGRVDGLIAALGDYAG
ncbi:sulfotransferase [Caulobacter sp. KR2-114]|uniref:sulfotransferase family protein n=1 Tax=Caulobacter sp. KR2-114 TaxID=3400912 RepID=UPI003C005BC8